MYLIFSGTHPFKATNNFELCKRICNDQVNFNGPEWKAVSIEAKSLIKGMLTKNPFKRLNLEELQYHKWIKKYCKPRTKPKPISNHSTKNLMLFNSERKLEQALQSYINNKISIDYAAGKLLNIFEEMDQHGDGELPIDIIIQKFLENMQMESVLEDDLRKVITKMDKNGDGYI